MTLRKNNCMFVGGLTITKPVRSAVLTAAPVSVEAFAHPSARKRRAGKSSGGEDKRGEKQRAPDRWA